MMSSPTLRTRLALLLGTCALLVPGAASAYFSPEEVLLNKDQFLPPTSRETESRVERQATVSAERREQEQEEDFTIQHAAPPEEEPELEYDEGWYPKQEDEVLYPSAGDEDISDEDLELLRTIRLLTRIEDQQRILRYGVPMDLQPGAETLHGGAPPLAPTGLEAWVAAAVMVGSVLWTVRRARRAERNVWAG